MSDSGGVVRDVSWRDLCPWLMLTRTFALATSVQVLLAALLAVTLTPIGWQIGDRLLLVSDDTLAQKERAEVFPLIESHTQWPGNRAIPDTPRAIEPVRGSLPVTQGGLQMAPWQTAPIRPIDGVFEYFAAPFQYLFAPCLTWRKGLFIFGGAIWTLLVWCVPGAIITRAAALQFGREEPLDWDQAFTFAGKKWTSYLIAPLVPLAGVFALAMLLAISGWIMRIPVIGPIGVGAMWFLSLLLGFMMALLLLGLLFGWPLMWATIGSESSDAFDALSRSNAYTFQRPFFYLFYVLFSALLGYLGWLLVWQFTEAVIALTHWGIAWGLSEEYLRTAMLADNSSTAPFYANWSLSLIHFWEGLVRAIATSFSFTFFWCSAVGWYLLLRREVDQMEIDEVAVDEPEEKFTLPKLKPHASGVPTVEPTPTSPIKEGPVAHVPPLPPTATPTTPPIPPADSPPPAGP